MWKSFDKSTNESLRLVRHRATVSGALVDVVAASALSARCIRNSAPPSYYEEGKIKLPDKQREMLNKLAAQCEGGDLSPVNVIRDSSGYTGDPVLLRQAAGGATVSDPKVQDEILRFARETQSPSLLEAVSYAVIDAKTLERLGLPSEPGFSPALDKEMAVLIIRMRACESRGDCGADAILFPTCSAINGCVDDLREYGPKRIYGDKANRAVFPGLIGPDAPSPEAVKARWMRLQGLLQNRLF